MIDTLTTKSGKKAQNPAYRPAIFSEILTFFWVTYKNTILLPQILQNLQYRGAIARLPVRKNTKTNIIAFMKLEEITRKIYAEGVEKGNAEAEQIVEKAKQEAAAIVEKAKQEAADQLAQAQQKIAELDKNTRSELKLYADQSVQAVRTALTDLINGQVATDSVKAATMDPKFMQSLILKMAQTMAEQGEVVIETKDAEQLRTYFAQNAKALLDKGVTINEVKGIKTDFQIKPAQGGYKLAFGEQELVAYFKEFLRPQLIEMLF